MARFINYYEILGVTEYATDEEIRTNYRRIVSKCRPKGEDRKNITADTLQVMSEYAKQATIAYNILSDHSKRKAYNKVYENVMIAREKEEYEKEMAQRRNQNASSKGKHLKENQKNSNVQTSSHVSKQNPNHSTEKTDFRIKNDSHIPVNSSLKNAGKHQVVRPNTIDYLTYAAQVTTDTAKRMGKEYKEVRKDEKANSYKKRHDKREQQLNKTLHINPEFEDHSKITTMSLCKGTVHVFSETFYQLGQFIPKKGETATKYVIRNRRKMAGIILAGMLFTNALVKNPDDQDTTLSQSEIAATQTYEVPKLDLEEKEEATVTINCYHTLVDGEYLALFSDASNTSIDELKEINNIENASHVTAGSTIKVPYVIKLSDLGLYRTRININNGTPITEDLAITYDTDIEGLLTLNGGQIISENNNTYKANGDYIYVPNFLSAKEYHEIKNNSQADYTTSQHASK